MLFKKYNYKTDKLIVYISDTFPLRNILTGVNFKFTSCVSEFVFV